MGVAKSYETRWHVTILLNDLVSSMHDWDSQIFILYSSTDDNGLFHFLLVHPPADDNHCPGGQTIYKVAFIQGIK